jgi:hypothetical protein
VGGPPPTGPHASLRQFNRAAAPARRKGLRHDASNRSLHLQLQQPGGTFDRIKIVNPEGNPIATLFYWDEPDTDEATRVEASARLICQHLNRWWFSGEWVEVSASTPNDGRKDATTEPTNNAVTAGRAYSPAPWSYEYSPYTITSDASPLGVGSELPAYEVFDAQGNKVFDTNENTPEALQQANARLASAAPRMLSSLITCANLLADYEESGAEEGQAYRESQAAIAEASFEPSDCRKPVVIVVRGGVVQDVYNLPPGTLYEIRDYDDEQEISF